MPIKYYGVLKAKVFDRQLATKTSEHYQMLVNRGSNPQRIAINTQSATPPSQVLYYADLNFQHTITDAILKAGLPDVFQPLASKPGGIALDFVREKLFDVTKMVPLPGTSTGNSNDLNDQLDLLVEQAIQDADAVLYAFGQHWLDASGADQYFPEINPSTGVHDIHMNQGNPKGSFYKDNGIYQDGGLLFYFPSEGRWAGVFTAFQSESFATDGNGDPV
ncbi:MAG TPA: YukJ family protein [Puia sp.]|nr:YukJ family protein [Puia sp.]